MTLTGRMEYRKFQIEDGREGDEDFMV